MHKIEPPRPNAKSQSVSHGLMTRAAKPKVLIVDDEHDIVEEIVELLEEDFDCITAHNASHALSLVDSIPEIGIVISDVRMPGMDGLEMIRELQNYVQDERYIYTIIITGHAGTSEAIDALRNGATDFLTKPVSTDHLRRAVYRAREAYATQMQEQAFQTRLKEEVHKKTCEARKLADDLAQRNKSLTASNRELAIANRVKTDFLSMISLELNTPLTAINGFASLMQTFLEKEGNETYLEYISHILISGHKLQKTIESIIDISARHTDQLKLSPTPFSLHDLFIHVIGLSREKAKNKSINLYTQHYPNNAILFADRIRISQGLTYILDNAIKFSPENSDVCLSASHDDTQITISVQDSGPGMRKDEIEQALQPLHQLSSGERRTHAGIGLGLNLACIFVELHGGHIEIESTLGRGTCVHMSLPIQFEWDALSMLAADGDAN